MTHFRTFRPLIAGFAGLILFLVLMGQYWDWRERMEEQRFQEFSSCVYNRLDSYFLDNNHVVDYADASSTANHCFEIYD